jgi:XTP/dITP diphosphohydrolase
MKLILATKNPGKLRELFELAGENSGLELELAPEGFGPEETGTTFAENAIIKAEVAAHMTKTLSLGEDSGIAVDALNGAPGVYSARYCEGSDRDRTLKLLNEMTSVPDGKRDAEYVCAMALVSGDGTILHISEGKWQGAIAHKESGTNGFGYDPIFFLPDLGKTSADISREEKNERSHRAKAWHKMLKFIATQLAGNLTEV